MNLSELIEKEADRLAFERKMMRAGFILNAFMTGVFLTLVLLGAVRAESRFIKKSIRINQRAIDLADSYFEKTLEVRDVFKDGEKHFTHTEDSWSKVMDKVAKKPTPINVRDYFDNPYIVLHQFMGTYYDGQIYVNTLKANTDCHVVGTLVHEYMHYLGYGHGDNRKVGKGNSVPYWFGGMATVFCMKGLL